MEEKEHNRSNQVLLTVIGIATLLIALVGATFAFFSANGVIGNTTTNTITAQTAQYGTTTVTYDATYPTINTGILDLKSSEQGTNYEYLMKLTVATTATTGQAITINWRDVNNTFCQYASGQNCTGDEGDTYVGDEIFYDFYSCDAGGYAGTTATGTAVTIDAGCTKISSPTPVAVPTGGSTGIVHTAASLPLAAGATNYYALVVTIKNLTSEQNYNQDKSFTGQVNVGLVVQ